MHFLHMYNKITIEIVSLFQTTRGMLENFLSIIDRFGMIPNGGRVYYLARSQPPLLAYMIKEYTTFSRDDSFARQNVAKLAAEFDFFQRTHTVDVKGYTLFRYGDNSLGPRPESYREDVETSEHFNTDAEKEEHYSELKAGAESGMDFSSRWFVNSEGTNNGSLVHLKTRTIVPVELNVILHWNAKYIAELYRKEGKLEEASTYEQYAQQIFDAIEAVLWHEDLGIWLDYDMVNKKRRNYFVPTNLSPLWMNCYREERREEIAEMMMKYIHRTDIDTYLGGVPNTLNHSGEQWDFPNVWPPMQHMLIEGLENLHDPKTSEIALRWATRWVQSNFIGWDRNEKMYEKVG